jgi:hypothetical protein
MTVIIYTHEIGDGTCYQVCVGPFSDAQGARLYADREMPDGLAYLVQHMTDPYSMAH